MALSVKDAATHHLELSKEHAQQLQQNTTDNNAGEVRFLDDNGNVRRIPIPSDDLNDPLNMHKWRKFGIVFCCCWFSVFSLVLVGGLGSILPVFIEMYARQGTDPNTVQNLGTYPSLVMVCGCLLILPLSLVFGRRPVFLGCSIVLLAATIGAAKSTTYETHLACRILQGIATGATESVLPLIITDISFLDERGFLFGWYWGIQSLLNAVFNICSSYLVAATSWQWFYWVLAIFCAVGLVLSIFLLPETKYERGALSMNGQVVHTDEFGVTEVLTDEEARERFGDLVNTSDNNAGSWPRTSYVKSLRLTNGVAGNPWKLASGALIKMVTSLSSPAVVWAVLASSISLGVGISMTLTYGTILTTSFGWSQASVGLVNCGIIPAVLFAILFAGLLADRLNIFLAKRRGGKHIPEHILVTLAFPTLVSMIGIIVYAVTAQWPARYSQWGIILGWSLYQFGFTVAIINTTHFAAEAYPLNPGPALVMVVGLKNVVSFGASYGIIPMVMTFDYLTAYMILFGIFTGIFVLGIPIYFLNPIWRTYIAEKKQT